MSLEKLAFLNIKLSEKIARETFSSNILKEWRVVYNDIDMNCLAHGANKKPSSTKGENIESAIIRKSRSRPQLLGGDLRATRG